MGLKGEFNCSKKMFLRYFGHQSLNIDQNTKEKENELRCLFTGAKT